MVSSFATQQPAPLALPAALLLGFPLIVQFLSPRQRKLELGASLVIEIEFQGNERHALALDRADELTDLPAMQKKLARALGSMIEAAALQIFGDIGIDQPDLATSGIGIGLGDGRLALPQRLYFGSSQRDPGLECFADGVIEPRLAIVCDGSE